MDVQIKPVSNRSDLHQFIRFPYLVYKDDPAWVPPLISEEKKRLNKKKNPFFEHAEACYFLAEENGNVLGRISAHIDHLHNQTHSERTGFFGFFESVNDPSVSSALLDKAAEWQIARGMTHLRGPANFSINEEAGILVDGFGQPPFIMMAHSPPYYQNLIEGWGMIKAKDLYCWKYDSLRPVPEVVRHIVDAVRAQSGVQVREVDPKNIERDVKIIVDVFNSAWRQNWGFVPMTEKEIRKTADDFKMILEPKLALIAEVNGEPAAISLALPNLNEGIKDLGGRLFPFGLIKLMYRLKTRKIRSARLIALGIKKEFRNDILKGLSVLLYSEMHRRSRELNHWGGELSWTLEDNQKINHGIALMGGVHYKTYRVYEREI